MSLGVKLKVGKTNVRTTGYPSESGFVRQVNQGMRKIQEDLGYIIQQFEDVTPEFMLEAMRPIFDESQRIVPVRTSALKDSGYLEIVEFRGSPKVEIGYAKGGNPWYAVYVHEMIEIPHRPPTQAKYLEKPVNDGLGALIDTLAAQYKEFMG
jgi:hypothetical protein